MNLANEVRKLFAYLLGKKSEIQAMDLKDVLLAKAVLDIHRTRTHKELVKVPLHSLRLIHPLDRDTSMAATERRARALAERREEILEHKEMTREVLAEVLPSVSWIKVVRENEDAYIAYEGNGRIAAMQQVFGPEDAVLVEVELYHVKNPRNILRRINRVRRMNGLLPASG